jgi:eukaryotic-like serine/threonine-protein kinase
MPLTPGTRLGPYEIAGAIGAGGMGEVYRARDTRLDRTVAIKILPESFSNDRERLERFQQEARILSALNHPNLIAIYDVGSQDGMRFLVSEFLEGQTLRERLETGPIPLRRLNEYSLQIARGLAAAHEKAIVHRDLKPENIFVLRDERIKILDFGLAKQAATAAAADLTVTSTNRTAAGTVLGTVGYMSPEQVRGEAVDHRSDIFSFGTILYEMVSGKRAFRGDSGVEVMSAILKQEPPDLPESAAHVPIGLQRIVHRCLEKKLEARFQSASDLAFAFESLSSAGTSTAGLRALADSSKNRSRILLAGLLVAALAVGVMATLLLHHSAASHPSFTQITFRSAYLRHARFAPDGRTVVYDATTNGQPTELFSTRTDSIEAHPLGIHAGVLSVSATGELALLLDPRFAMKWVPTGLLARAPLGSVSTRELQNGVTDADWSPDGSSLALSRDIGHHFQLEFPPGKVLYQNDGYISDLRVSPAGDKVAFVDHALLGDDRGNIDVIDLQGNRKVLTEEFSSAQGLVWAHGGNEIWFTAVLTTEPSSLREVDLSGHQRMVLSSPARLHLHDVSKDGDVLLSVEDFRDQQLLSDSASGQARDVSAFPFQITAAISRDGSMLLLNTFVTGANSDYNMYTQRTDGSSPVMIGQGIALGFSSDVKWTAALDPIHLEQLRIIPTGMGEARTLNAPAGQKYMTATWMPDSKRLLVMASAAGRPVLYVQDVANGAIRQVTTGNRYSIMFDSIPMNVSPDGKYCVTTDGENHYWLQPIDGGEPSEIKGMIEGDFPLQWHKGSQNIFFERWAAAAGSAVDIYDLDVATGKSKLWTHFTPADKSALLALRPPLITPDGAHTLYSAQRIYSTLFVAKGIQ